MAYNGSVITAEAKQKEYECIGLLKSHPEIFTYDKQNDIYYSRMFSLAIGNKRQLQHEVEQHCKNNNEVKVGKLFEDYSNDDVLVADYNNENRVAVLPIGMYFSGREILRQIEEAKQQKLNDKYYNSSVEAQYDGYLSSEEEVDLKEISTNNDIDFDIERE